MDYGNKIAIRLELDELTAKMMREVAHIIRERDRLTYGHGLGLEDTQTMVSEWIRTLTFQVDARESALTGAQVLPEEARGGGLWDDDLDILELCRAVHAGQIDKLRQMLGLNDAIDASKGSGI